MKKSLALMLAFVLMVSTILPGISSASPSAASTASVSGADEPTHMLAEAIHAEYRLSEHVDQTVLQETFSPKEIAVIPRGTGVGQVGIEEGPHGEPPIGPTSLLVTDHDELMLLDAVNHRVLVISLEGRGVRTIEFSRAIWGTDLAVDTSGNIYVLDGGAEEILLLAADSSQAETIKIPTEGGFQPSRLATDSGLLMVEGWYLASDEATPGKTVIALPESGSDSETVSTISHPDSQYTRRGLRYIRLIQQGPYGAQLAVGEGESSYLDISIETPWPLVGTTLVDYDADGNLYIYILTYAPNAEGLLYYGSRLDKYSPDGDLLASVPLPIAMYSRPSRPLAVSATGIVYQLRIESDRVSIVKWEPNSVSLSLEGPPDVWLSTDGGGTAFSSAPPTEAVCSNEAILALSPITRDQIMSIAQGYANHSWTVGTANYYARECNSCPVGPAAWPIGTQVTGVAYMWGGWDSVSGFDTKLSQGYLAGDVTGTLCSGWDCVTGVDCSGFVQQTWQIVDAKRNTYDLVSDSYSQHIEWSDLLRGDALGIGGVHIALFSNRDAEGHIAIYESVYDSPHKVRYYVDTWGYLNGYEARRRHDVSDDVCSAPTLISPADGYTSSGRTVTFQWSPPSNCTPDGYTFRVKTVPDMDSGGTTIFDEGVGETQVTKELGSQWDNTDLYWSVRACKPCDPYTPGSWAPSRRFRIGTTSGDTVAIFEHADYSGTQYGWHDPGTYNFPDYMNDRASSIRIAAGWSARLYEHNDQEGGYICINSDDSNFSDNSFNTGLGLNDQASSIEVYSQDTCPPIGNPPGTPTLVSPANGSIHSSTTPITLDWSNSDGATEYYAHLWGGPSIDINSGWNGNTSWLIGTLWPGVYYWQVKARNAYGDSGWSSTWSFTVCALPAAVSLSSPSNGSTINDSTPTFSWGIVSGATSYRIQVDNNADFSSYEVALTIPDTSYTLGFPLPGDTYYWRVQATSPCGTGPWSETWQVTIATDVCNDPHEPNDYSAQATAVSYGDTLTDPDICLGGDEDYYAFAGSAGDTIIAYVDAQSIGSMLDSDLVLYDTDGVTVLALNHDYDGFDSLIEYTLPGNGTYYLMVREYNHPNEGGADYFYTISLGTSPALYVHPTSRDFGTMDEGQTASWDFYIENTGGHTLNWTVSESLSWASISPSSGSTTSETDSVTVNVDTTGLTPGQHYDGYLTLDSNGGTEQVYVEVTICQVPSAPSLSSPSNASVVSDSTPTFSWGAVSGATSYSIQVDNNSDFSSLEIDANTSDTFYTPGTTLPDDTYYWRVQASNSCGTGAWSATWQVTVAQPIPPPSAPMNLNAIAASQTQIDLTWTDNADNEDGFRIERSLSETSGFVEIDTVSTDVTSCSDSGLSPDTHYYYRVYAFNTAGDSAAYAAGDATTLSLPPAAPSSLVATAISESQIDLTWVDNADNEDGFMIERSLSESSGFVEIGTVDTNLTSYADTSLSSATTYYYRVYAFNTAGYSAYSNEADATTPNLPPDAPSSLTAIAVSESEIDLTWVDNADNEDGFRIERSLYETSGFAQIATVGADITSYSDTGLSGGTTYYYRVYAFNTTGDSTYATDEATTLPVGGSTIHVPQEYPTISQALDAASPGDTVQVAAGTYLEQNLGVPDGVALLGSGADQTMIQGNGTGTVVYIGGNAVISGFTVTGSGMDWWDSGIWISDGQARISENIVAGNSMGIVYYCFSPCEGQPRIQNNIAYGNQADGILAHDGIVTAVNNTSVYNGMTGIAVDRAGSTIVNNVFSGNRTGIAATSTAPLADYNNVWGNGEDYKLASPGAHDISADPLFVSVSADDYRIEPASPNVDSGASVDVDVDVEGDSRPYDGNGDGTATFDIGADEYVGPPVLPPLSPSDLVATAVSGSQIDLTWADNAENEDGFRIERSLYETSGFAQIDTLSTDITSYSDSGLTPDTHYYYRVYAFNTAGDSAYTAASATTDPPGSSIHVGDLDGGVASTNKNFWWAEVIATVHDAAHNPVAGATVSGTWSGDASGADTCITDVRGQCRMVSPKTPISLASVTFTVDNVTHPTLPYNPLLNHDPDGDSDGTTIMVSQIGNQPPVAAFSYECVELACTFDGSGSSDPDGTIVDYVWDFGDGNGGTGVAASYTYLAEGTYTVSLTVTDDSGAADTAVRAIYLGTSGGTMFVYDIEMSGRVVGANRRATVMVAVHDTGGIPLQGVTVYGIWSGDYNSTVTGVTGDDGTVTFDSAWLHKTNATFTFTVDDLVMVGYTYDPDLDIKTSETIVVP